MMTLSVDPVSVRITVLREDEDGAGEETPEGETVRGGRGGQRGQLRGSRF